jgi:hypothetical protein
MQMKNFTINSKVYKAKEFDFNLVCDLEDEGISLEVMQDKPMSMMRAYFGICAGIGRKAAGEEMQKHIVSGGSFEEMAEAMSDAMEQSDFFRAANKTTEAETAENQSEAE